MALRQQRPRHLRNPPNARPPGGGEYDLANWQNTSGLHSRHIGGVQFALADGSARLVRNSVALATYRAIATIQGGESVELPE